MMKKTFVAFGLAIGLGASPLLSYGQEAVSPDNSLSIKREQNTLEDKVATGTAYQIYGSNIVYQDLSKIDFDSLPKENIPVPTDLKWKIEWSSYTTVKNEKAFQKLVLDQASELGYNQEKISALSAEGAIKLSVDIVASKLTYHRVDEDEEFISKYGKMLPTETYLELGLGDCDKYTSALSAVFRIIKDKNPKLDNVYISNSALGHLPLFHAWNSLICLTGDKVIISHIDSTFYDKNGELEAKKGYHIPENNLYFLALFYNDIRDDNASFGYYNQLYSQVTTTEAKAFILGKMAPLALYLRDKDKMESIRTQYYELNTEAELDSILFYSYMVEKDYGDSKQAEQFKKELFEKCQDSFYTEIAKESVF